MIGSSRKPTLEALKSSGLSLTKLAQAYCNENETEQISMKCSRRIVRPEESFSSEQFFNFLVDKTGGLFGFYWPFPFVCLFAWLLTGLFLLGGIRALSRIVFFTVPFTVSLTAIFVICALILDKKGLGVQFYLKTEFCTLTDSNLWLEAMAQAFFSLDLSYGPVTTLASFNRFHNDIFLDSLIIAFADLGYR